MKILRIITILLGVVALATMVAVLFDIHSRRVVDSEVSEVYRRYCDRDDLKVAFVKDYRVGDSITVDVTTITAKDSAGWEALLREMNIYELKINFLRKSYNKGTKSVSSYYCLKDHPEQLVPLTDDTQEVNLVVYLQHIEPDRTFFVFATTSVEQAKKIRYDYISKLDQ